MIFSVIIIITIIGVAVYAITAFLQVGKTAQLGLFHREFQKTVDEIWSSATTNKLVSFAIPTSIEAVCFGSIEGREIQGRYSEEFEDLKKYSSGFEQKNNNVFLYPSQKAKDFAFNKIDKLDLSGLGEFDCFETKNGEVKIRLSKGEFDSLVKVGHE